jgi:hypothetical protein
MSERIPTHSEKEPQPTREERIISLAKELFESNETFPFFGIDLESYLKMKAGEAEDPGYTTPIDENIERFKIEGMKVVQGKNPQSGNVYVLPAGSTDIEMDGIFPRQLKVSEGMDPRLKELILLGRGSLLT